MTKEEAQTRVDSLWESIRENVEENTFMQQEIDQIYKEFPDLD